MPKQIALLEISFLFDPTETFSHLYEFEGKFGEFLKTIGLEAEVMVPIGMSTKRILFIRKIEEIPPVTPPLEEAQKGPQQAIKDMKKGLK